jgi:C4-dicarboxylate-specific signal transduction histidine kinase
METLLTRVRAEDRAMAAEVMLPASLGAKDAEFRVTLADRSTRWIAARSELRDENGASRRRLSGSFADVTARKTAELEAELQQAELAHLTRASVLGQLSGAIAHELNQPLTAILANAQAVQHILQQPNPDISQVVEAIDDIVSEDHRAGEVIRRLLGLLRKSEARSEPVDLNDVARSTLKLLNSELVARRVAVTANFSDSLPFILGDSVQLQQVLINLLVNAMDALNAVPPAQRRIEVGTGVAPSGAVSLYVDDSGTGLPPDQPGRVFEPFFTTKANGLGLGLPICFTIVGRHGGTLSVDSKLSGGVRAVVSLPAQELAVAAQ